MVRFCLSDFFSPHRLLYWRYWLWKSQYWPQEKLFQFQWKLLSKILDHCFENVPYYKHLFKEIGLKRNDITSLDCFKNIPIIDKMKVKAHFDLFKATNFPLYNPKKIHTTGTTGTPMTFFWDNRSNILELMCQYRHFSWAGYRLGEPFLDIRSVAIDNSKGYKWNWKCQGLEFSSDNINSSNIEMYAEILRKYRIKLWRGYPLSIDYLCRMLNKADIQDIKPEYVVSVSYGLMDYQRKFIEDWTGVPVCDNYGQNEHIALICQCPEAKGYHIASEYGIVEIIKDNGKPAKPGEQGRIVATGIHNYAFPLLRYDTKDYAIASDKTCSCGRTLPLIEKLTGRIEDFLLDTRENWVSGFGFPLRGVEGIQKAQIIQTKKDFIKIYLVLENNYTADTDLDIIKKYKLKLGQTMKIKISHVEEVPFPRYGQKYKFVINKLREEKQYS